MLLRLSLGSDWADVRSDCSPQLLAARPTAAANHLFDSLLRDRYDSGMRIGQQCVALVDEKADAAL